MVNKTGKILGPRGLAQAVALCQASLLRSSASYFAWEYRTESAENDHTTERSQQKANQAMLHKRNTG